MAPIAIDPIHQKDAADCAIAAVAMYTGLAYRTVSRRVVDLVPGRPHHEGLSVRAIGRLLQALGSHARRWPRMTVRHMEFEGATGLLDLHRRREGHLVVLFQGVVVNPADGMIWDLETFLARGQWTIAGFWG